MQPAFTRFQAVIDHHLNNNFKMQTIAMNYKNRHPWMTEELRTQIKHKNALYAAKLKKSDKDIQEKYKKLKNELTSSMKNKEILYYSNQLEIHKNDISKSWKIIKQIIGKDSCKSSTNQEFCIGNTSITDSTAIANGFNNFLYQSAKRWPKDGQKMAKDITSDVNPMSYINSIEHSIVITDISYTEVTQVISTLKNSSAGWDNNFFVSIGQKLAKDITSDVNPMSYINSIEHSIVITDISYTEVTQVISTLKNSSAGWDELPTFVAKKCISGYIEPLTYLINTSFTEGIFPKELKLARVVPIFKIGDKTELTNYRPISVLSFFSKVFEKIMYTHLLDFIEQNKIIYKHQYGFRQKHSTQHAIITLVDRITNSLDKGDIVISIFLDLKKASNTVDHPTLLNKLYAYGIRGNAFNWFKSYLSERSQYVVYDSKQSKMPTVQCGVPQGSILGPLLFIIYMNDICNASELMFSIL